MSVVKIIELVGESPVNWEEAIQEAIKEASKTVKKIVSADVIGFSTKINENKVSMYRVNVKVAFIVTR